MKKFSDVPVQKSQIRKFVMINPQIENPQFPWSPSPHLRKFGKSSVSDPEPHWFASSIFFLPRRYILDYEMPCKLHQMPKVHRKFQWEHFKLIFVRSVAEDINI
jgi:hypothetical protein